MSTKPFNKVLSTLVTKNLYRYHFYSYLKDRELMQDETMEKILAPEEKKLRE